ncbi:Cu-Zn family superoxide dismutase [Virgibacillus natechei]|uniref:Cu-Zn family superoxide dismutase n=1 Tax=Virgibacillus natechei TaxID=1216297 RepID=A0ABS4IF10_9BACI|nr:superoxide dismutase family protein [Virgibacillus natechei]MBP1969541.1 Cu-Zn family superoxide dismutase [Virgibacillus natechei]UZD11758.1 superoxide dismutase family protein [Virgibacillus natechei]
MRLIFLLMILFMVSCQSDDQSAKTVEMYNASGDMVGTANLSEQSDGVEIELTLEGLDPGFHGIHVHENPNCEGPDFTSAGNHLNPEGDDHGLMHPEGSHLGDLPNIEADDDGQVEAELIIEEATLLDGRMSILEGGTSLVIKEEQDDGVSQPGGDSGARIICGEIKKDDEVDVDDSPTDPTQFNEEQDE